MTPEIQRLEANIEDCYANLSWALHEMGQVDRELAASHIESLLSLFRQDLHIMWNLKRQENSQGD